MENKVLLDILREFEEKIYNTFKVASVGVIEDIKDNYNGYKISLLPRINNQQTFIYTNNVLMEQVEKDGKKDWDHAVKKGDSVLVIFLDYITKNFTNHNLSLDDQHSKHTYNNAVIVSKLISGDIARNELEQNKKEEVGEE